MTQRAKRFSWAVLFTVLGTLIVAFVVAEHVRPAATLEQPVLEIQLEANGTAFGKNNPTIEARAGERVRIVVRNTDPGVLHSIAVPSLGMETVDVSSGEEAVIELVADEPGTYEYACSYHLPLMKGKIVVKP